MDTSALTPTFTSTLPAASAVLLYALNVLPTWCVVVVVLLSAGTHATQILVTQILRLRTNSPHDRVEICETDPRRSFP